MSIVFFFMCWEGCVEFRILFGKKKRWERCDDKLARLIIIHQDEILSREEAWYSPKQLWGYMDQNASNFRNVESLKCGQRTINIDSIWGWVHIGSVMHIILRANVKSKARQFMGLGEGRRTKFCVGEKSTVPKIRHYGMDMGGVQGLSMNI